MQKDWKKLEMGALWKKASKGGDNFYTGLIKVEGKEIRLICFANKDKSNERAPDVRIYLDTEEKNGQGSNWRIN